MRHPGYTSEAHNVAKLGSRMSNEIKIKGDHITPSELPFLLINPTIVPVKHPRELVPNSLINQF